MRVPILLLAWSCMIASAQQAHFFQERIGMMGVSRAPATWSSPESVVRELRSDDLTVRRRAQRLLGVNEDFFSDDGANEIRMHYFSFGVARKPVAVVTAACSSFEYAAVAVPALGGWKRIAVFECWCKYDNEPSFVEIGYGPSNDAQALVTVHASGGGTGEYEQTEAWFGLRDDNLVEMLSFASRKRSCQLEAPCTYQRRWFDGRQLIEGNAPSGESVMNSELQARDFKSITCIPYKWDAPSFKYIRTGPAHPCKYDTPR